MKDDDNFRFTGWFNGAALLFESLVCYAVFKAAVFSVVLAFIHLLVANLIWAAMFKAALFRKMAAVTGKGTMMSLLRFLLSLFRRGKEPVEKGAVEIPSRFLPIAEGATSAFAPQVRATAHWMFTPSAVLFVASLFADKMPFIIAASAMALAGFIGMIFGKRLLILPVSFDGEE
jgi:hypothetical protein